MRQTREVGSRRPHPSASPLNLLRFSVELSHDETTRLPGISVQEWTQTDVVFVLEQLFVADGIDTRRMRITCIRQATVDGKNALTKRQEPLFVGPTKED